MPHKKKGPPFPGSPRSVRAKFQKHEPVLYLGVHDGPILGYAVSAPRPRGVRMFDERSGSGYAPEPTCRVASRGVQREALDIRKAGAAAEHSRAIKTHGVRQVGSGSQIHTTPEHGIVFRGVANGRGREFKVPC